MEAQATYRKSEKGAEAIATRGYGVAGRLRQLLIMVDGKKTVEELTRMAVGIGESAQTLQQLLDQGFIELHSAAAVAPSKSVAVGAISLGKIKSLATRLLVEQLGPQADVLAIKLEEASDIPQFIDAMKKAYAVVRDVKGAAAADRFGGEVEAQMPPI